MKNKLLITLFVLTLFLGCKTHNIQTRIETCKIEKGVVPIREYAIQAVLWQQ